MRLLLLVLVACAPGASDAGRTARTQAAADGGTADGGARNEPVQRAFPPIDFLPYRRVR